MPLVSVIIPIYNMAVFLPGAIQSVVDNDFSETEIIIIDDGSTDESLQIARQIAQTIHSPNIRVEVKSIARGGKSAALNEGLKLAGGDFITFLDADDVLPPGSLSIRARKLQTESSDIALGEFEVFNNKKITGRRTIPSESVSTLKRKMFYGWRTPFHLNGMLIKKEEIERVEFFDVQLLRGQEKDYAIRLLKSGAAISFIHEPVYRYRKYRSFSRRISIRLKTFRYTMKLLAKHTSGLRKVVVLAWNTVLEVLKFIFNLFGSYKK